MQIITSDDQLHRLIPHVLTTVEGEATLFEKLTPFLETSEEWLKQYFIPDELFERIVESGNETEEVDNAASNTAAVANSPLST